MIGYVVLVSKGDKLQVIDSDDNLSDVITEKTRILRHPMSASVCAIHYDQCTGFANGITAVYQFTGKGEDGNAILWKVTDHDSTAVSFVIVGTKDNKRVYHTGDELKQLADRLVDAYKFHSLKTAVEVLPNFEKSAACTSSFWNGVQDIHIENVVEDVTSIDIRQQEVRFPCALD